MNNSPIPMEPRDFPPDGLALTWESVRGAIRYAFIVGVAGAPVPSLDSIMRGQTREFALLGIPTQFSGAVLIGAAPVEERQYGLLAYMADGSTAPVPGLRFYPARQAPRDRPYHALTPPSLVATPRAAPSMPAPATASRRDPLATPQRVADPWDVLADTSAESAPASAPAHIPSLASAPAVPAVAGGTSLPMESRRYARSGLSFVWEPLPRVMRYALVIGVSGVPVPPLDVIMRGGTPHFALLGIAARYKGATLAGGEEEERQLCLVAWRDDGSIVPVPGVGFIDTYLAPSDREYYALAAPRLAAPPPPAPMAPAEEPATTPLPATDPWSILPREETPLPVADPWSALPPAASIEPAPMPAMPETSPPRAASAYVDPWDLLSGPGEAAEEDPPTEPAHVTSAEDEVADTAWLPLETIVEPAPSLPAVAEEPSPVLDRPSLSEQLTKSTIFPVVNDVSDRDIVAEDPGSVTAPDASVFPPFEPEAPPITVDHFQNDQMATVMAEPLPLAEPTPSPMPELPVGPDGISALRLGDMGHGAEDVPADAAMPPAPAMPAAGVPDAISPATHLTEATPEAAVEMPVIAAVLPSGLAVADEATPPIDTEQTPDVPASFVGDEAPPEPSQPRVDLSPDSHLGDEPPYQEAAGVSSPMPLEDPALARDTGDEDASNTALPASLDLPSELAVLPEDVPAPPSPVLPAEQSTVARSDGTENLDEHGPGPATGLDADQATSLEDTVVHPSPLSPMEIPEAPAAEPGLPESALDDPVYLAEPETHHREEAAIPPSPPEPPLDTTPLPSSLEAILEEAELYLLPQWADYAEVERLLAQVELEAPRHARVHELRARLRQALDATATVHIAALLDDAERHLAVQDCWGAVDLFEQVLKVQPDHEVARAGAARARLLARWAAQRGGAGSDPMRLQALGDEYMDVAPDLAQQAYAAAFAAHPGLSALRGQLAAMARFGLTASLVERARAGIETLRKDGIVGIDPSAGDLLLALSEVQAGTVTEAIDAVDRLMARLEVAAN